MLSTYIKVALKDTFIDLEVMRLLREIKGSEIVEDVSVEKRNKLNHPNYRPTSDYQSPWV